MKTIIFIGSNKSGSSREAIKAAERLGFFTVLLTDREIFLENRLDFPDVHQMTLMEISDYDLLKGNIKEIQEQGKIVGAIVSFIDPFVHVAAKLSKEFGLASVSPDPLVMMEDKVLTRELLKDLPVSPYFTRYEKNDSLIDFIDKQRGLYPLIVKTPVSSGSKDVLFVEDERQLAQSINTLVKKGSNEILIEEYLDGPQYLIEACVYNGKVHIVAVIEQEITFFNHFIVTGYCLLGDMDRVFYNKIYETVCLVLDRFKLKNGSCHIEMRLINHEWKLIEINPRISGGGMNRMIETAFGINLVEETIKIFLGQEPNLERKFNRFVYAHYLTSDSTGTLIKVTGKNRCSRLPGIEEVFIKPKKGKILHPPLSMGDRYGYVLASSDNKEEAMSIAKEAAKEIRFYIEPI
ncbi:ATP-grasp domain-containing protein [Sporosarcina sp. JAI121]|uniref:ATP-grasp domain-containing protein n=1 Tax=Sporosarcina sp. JAI121 TaxID=2723064 RepID=UPI0015CEC6DD|nr:ATP-grasp domain-containing protein [Sporosarcina sp. JAI121]NYF25050.1 biotin carboxylase [Sporosarcina sp. JAI121]